MADKFQDGRKYFQFYLLILKIYATEIKWTTVVLRNIKMVVKIQNQNRSYFLLMRTFDILINFFYNALTTLLEMADMPKDSSSWHVNWQGLTVNWQGNPVLTTAPYDICVESRHISATEMNTELTF